MNNALDVEIGLIVLAKKREWRSAVMNRLVDEGARLRIAPVHCAKSKLA
jgi:hypothetical protein